VRARSRSALTSLVLLALAGGALVWAWLGVDRKVEQERAAKDREEKVFAFAAKDVRTLAITAKGGTTRLERDGTGGGWKIVAPVAGPADAFAANGIAERLAGLRRIREAAPAPGGDLSRFGLAAPRVTVEATLASGATETLSVGADTGFDAAVFARPTSGAVLAVPGDVGWALDRSTEELREKKREPPPPAASPAPLPAGAPPKQG
jgi:hypothetical protein